MARREETGPTADIGPRAAQERAARPEPEHLPRGTCIGRYVILEPLGQGGMGVVYTAYDPKLDRRVAVKLLRVDGDQGSVASQARDRLLREAQALAQLAHPNVVAVYDAGTYQDDVFMAMELVEGQTLRRFLAGEKPSWRQILQLLLDAGRGLAAAHRAGLIHRDIKPDNLVLGNDGRVRVLDFGLARPANLPPDEGPPSSRAQPAIDSFTSGERRLSTPLTEQGLVIGTPAYMSPEQRDGGAIDAACDQFSFCVTAYEALYGQRPVLDGGAPRSSRVPTWVRRILLRGMSEDPSARFPSMEALLDALARDPAVRRWRVAAALGITALVAATTVALTRTVPTRLCRGADEQLAGAWDPTVQEEVHRAFLSGRRGYAEEAYQRVKQALDGYLQRWVGMRVEACEATRVRGVQSDRLMDLRMRCLDRRLQKVRSLTTVFARESGDDVLKQALPAVFALPPIEACADADALQAARPPPENPEVAAAVEALRVRLDRVEALKEAGKYKDALALAPALVADCRRVGHAPILAEALGVLGFLQSRSGQSGVADQTLREALLVGSRGGEDRLVADDWTLRIYNLGQQGHYADALAIRDAAEAAVERSGADPLLRGAFLGHVGGIFNRQEKYAEARPYFEQQLAILEAAFGPEHPSIAGVLSSLGNVLGAQGRYDEARRSYERSIAIYEKVYGPHHPSIGTPLNNLGNLLSDHGEYDEARRRYLRAIEIWDASLGPGSSYAANTYNSLGSGALERRCEDAWRDLSRAREVWQRTLEPNHPDLGMVECNLGEVLLETHRPAEACAYFQRALTMEQKSLDATDPSLGVPLTGMGECLLALRRPAEALPHLEQALRIREAAHSRPAVFIDNRFALAKALDALGRDPARAKQLARQAYEDTAVVAIPAAKKVRVEISAWLAAH